MRGVENELNDGEFVTLVLLCRGLTTRDYYVLYKSANKREIAGNKSCGNA